MNIELKVNQYESLNCKPLDNKDCFLVLNETVSDWPIPKNKVLNRKTGPRRRQYERWR